MTAGEEDAAMEAIGASGQVPSWNEEDLARGVIDRFQRVARTLPDHLALVDGDGLRLDYRQLDTAAREIAAEIVALLGTGGGHVGLYSDLRGEAVIGMLAIVAAGKAYVPIDPSEPAPRIRAKIEDAEIRVVVAPSALESRASDLLGNAGRVVVARPAQMQHVGFTPTLRHPDDDFNLIYTSGSTGVPKGVIQNHRNVLFDTAASTELFPVGPDDTFGLVVPLTFGASVSDVAGALLNGAVLDVFDVKRRGIEAMAAWMREEAITVTHMVPTVLRRWMNVLTPSDLYPSMRMIKSGGESLLRHDFEAFSAHFGTDSVLRNGLGTTETYLIAAEMLHAGEERSDAILPVGHSAPGRSVAVLGENGAELPAGEVGQIAVTSRYLSPGYWRDPAATERAFSTDPADPTLRTYLTGDLGRLRPDGRLEHLGRVDDMVKVMGQRVELSEIETVLLEQPGVAEAVVVPSLGSGGETRLAAYLVTDGHAPGSNALRSALAAALPRYMIPARFVTVESMPTLPFGKIDRRALVDVGNAAAAPHRAYTAPRTEREAQVAAVAAALLGLDRVGVEDDLFGLGLDSLSATQLVGRILTATGIEVSVDTVFEAPTVGAIAAGLEDTSSSATAGDLETLLAQVELMSDADAERALGGLSS